MDISKAPSRKRATVIQTAGGYVNTGIVVVQGLLLIPLYLHYIGAHMYGLWLASGGMLGMLTLMNFGISSMLIQRVSRSYGEQNLEQAGAYFFNGMIVYLFICLLFGLAGWVVSVLVPEILHVTGDDAELLRRCFQIAVVAMTIGILNECLRSFGLALLRPVVPMVGIAVGRIFGIAVTVWMLLDEFGLWAIPMGILVAETVIFIVNLFNAMSLFRRLATKICLDSKIIKEYVRTSPALLMATVGNTVARDVEPLLITVFLSPEVTTAYMVTRRAADIVLRMLNVIVGSTMGSFAHLAGGGDREKTVGIAKHLLFLSFSVGTIGFATYVGTNHAFVSLWVGESFVLGHNIMLFIGLGFFARTFRGLLWQMLYGLGDFIYPSVVILLEGIARITLAVWLLSMLGVLGMPLAFTLSCSIAIVVLGFRLTRQLSMSFYFPAMVRFLLSGAALFGISISLVRMEAGIDSWSAFTLHLMMLLAGFLAMYILMNWSRCRESYKSILI
ncbi:MAG TPA: MATE family efflux transporter [Gammaproteobacteria bacterium]|nr:MATE family efflux transporter [Gammaproteobacteria bacterium]